MSRSGPSLRHEKVMCSLAAYNFKEIKGGKIK